MSYLIKSLRSCAEYESHEFQRLPHEHIAWRAADEIEGLRKRLADAEAKLAETEKALLVKFKSRHNQSVTLLCEAAWNDERGWLEWKAVNPCSIGYTEKLQRAMWAI